MTTGSEWTSKVGGSWAREWERTDRSFGALTERLIEFACSAEFSHALDVGCGAGETSLLLAGCGSGRVTGIDISAELLSVARTRGRGVPQLDFVEADAARWQPTTGRVDLVASRHGVMFFDQPVSAFASLRNNAQAGSRLVFSCFRSRAENEWVTSLDGIVESDEPVGETAAPGPFAFGNRDHVAAVLSDAGWRDIEFEPVDYAMVAGEGDDPLADALSYFLRIGPAARKVAELEGEAKQAATARLAAVLQSYLSNGKVALPSAAWIVSARG